MRKDWPVNGPPNDSLSPRMLTSSSLRLRTSCVRLNPPQLTITSPKSFGVNVLHPALRFHRHQICIPASIAIDQQRRGGYVNYREGSRNHLGTQRILPTGLLTASLTDLHPPPIALRYPPLPSTP